MDTTKEISVVAAHIKKNQAVSQQQRFSLYQWLFDDVFLWHSSILSY
jgi:hypothetical protein